ncbi:hypothetical protein D1007_00599 [Hordeum vulgare]|nr:hypothetical protein D1007_00599 [Hordeum vulgare]
MTDADGKTVLPPQSSPSPHSRLLLVRRSSRGGIASSTQPECVDIQIDHDPLPSTPAPSSSTLSPVFPLHDVNEPDLHKEIKVDEKNDPGPSSPTISSNFPLHDFKDPDSNKEIKDD